MHQRQVCMHCAESVGTDLKSLGTAPVRVLPHIVPAPTAESRAASRLDRRWDGIRTGYAGDLFDRIQRVFNRREGAPARTPNSFRALVRTTGVSLCRSVGRGGHIDLRNQRRRVGPQCAGELGLPT